MEDKERYKVGERAIAPIVATVVPALIVTVLMVVTAISSRPLEKIEVDIAHPVGRRGCERSWSAAVRTMAIRPWRRRFELRPTRLTSASNL